MWRLIYFYKLTICIAHTETMLSVSVCMRCDLRERWRPLHVARVRHSVCLRLCMSVQCARKQLTVASKSTAVWIMNVSFFRCSMSRAHTLLCMSSFDVHVRFVYLKIIMIFFPQKKKKLYDNSSLRFEFAVYFLLLRFKSLLHIYRGIYWRNSPGCWPIQMTMHCWQCVRVCFASVRIFPCVRLRDNVYLPHFSGIFMQKGERKNPTSDKQLKSMFKYVDDRNTARFMGKLAKRHKSPSVRATSFALSRNSFRRHHSIIFSSFRFSYFTMDDGVHFVHVFLLSYLIKKSSSRSFLPGVHAMPYQL